MVSRPVLRRSLSRLVSSVRYSTQIPLAREEPLKERRIHLATNHVPKRKRQPFLKGLFQGKIDMEVMSFPEILSGEDISELETHVMKITQLMAQKVNSTEIDRKQEIPEEFLQDLKDLGLYGRMIPTKYGGLQLTHTACLRLNEVLGSDWAVGSTLAAHEFLASQVILQFGSDEQKSLYLPRLASGNLIAAFCCAEMESGSDLWSLKTTATETTEGDFVISGTKSWVSNARDAGLFIVFAKTRNPLEPSASGVSVFLVEKGRGVNVSPHDKIGLRGLDTGHVHFEDVPASSIIGTLGNGFQVYLKALESFRVASSTFTFGALKSLLDSVTTQITHKQRSGKSLVDYQMVRGRLSRVSAMIFAMESASYFTAALLDSTDEPDTAMEAAALQVFNSEATLSCVRELTEAAGSASLAPSHLLERAHRDALHYCDDVCRLYLGLSSAKLIGERRQGAITHIRNPWMFPKEKVMRNFRCWRMNRRDFRLDQDIAGRLHPALAEWSRLLEETLQIFEFAVEGLVARHGRGVVERQVDPIRVAGVAAELYVWASVLARTSRCSQHELAAAYCHDAHRRVLALLDAIVNDETSYNDRSHLFLGEHVVNCGGYFAEHPLKHNY